MKKYKLFIDCTLVLLCLFPLISLLCMQLYCETLLSADQILSHLEVFNISSTISNSISNALNDIGFMLDGGFSSAVSIILSNSILIYIFYVFVNILLFVPKLAIKFFRIGVRKDD